MNHTLLFRETGRVGYAREHREVWYPKVATVADFVRSFLIRIFTVHRIPQSSQTRRATSLSSLIPPAVAYVSPTLFASDP